MSQVKVSLIYNPARLDRKELIESFVVRTRIFNEIFKDIKSSEMIHPEQHYIIQGIRGQGKTTLLLRIVYEIMNDSELNKRLIPIVFNEEQYHVTRLYKLWESIAEQLEDIDGFKGLSDEIESLEDADDYEYLCFEVIENRLKNASRKIIVFIDNIDEMFAKFTEKELHRLREVFIQSAEIRIIGASSTMLEFHHDYGKPFYQFFKMPVLKGLDMEETRTLLLGLGEYYKKDHVKEVLEKQPGRIEALRRLTGGVIRIIVILFEIFMDDDNGSAFHDLEKILDSVTPLYKHRMDSLPVQQQEIVDFIALRWDAVTVKEIAAKTGLKSNAISAQLNQLEKYSIIEKEKTSTKNYLYRIHERFFNIWYLMRHGRKKDERRVRFLVEFLQTWCDHDQLEHRADRHIRALEKGLMADRHAYLMTNALIKTGLSHEKRIKLLDSTITCLERQGSELCDDVQGLYKAYSEADQDEELNYLGICAFVDENNPAKAEECFLDAIEKGHAGAMSNLALLYEQEYKDFEKAEKYYLMACEKDNAEAMNNLALLYHQEYKDFKKAEKYYLMAIGKGDAGAMSNLALLYHQEYKDFKKAEKYYLMAIGKGDAGAMYNLALLYEQEYKDFEKAEKYYLMAIGKGDAEAMNNLAFLYHQEYRDFEKSEKYYLMAVDKDHAGAMYNLALLYEQEYKDFEKAEKYYLMAIGKGDAEAMNNLALLYHQEYRDFEKSEKYYLMAVDKDHAGAMNNLALLYHQEYRDFEKSEKYYLMAVDKDYAGAMNNLAFLYHQEYRDFEKAEKYYLMAVDKDHAGAMNNLALLYHQEYRDFEKAEKYYLMAVDKDHAGAMNALAWLYFINVKNREKALILSRKAYKKEQNPFFSNTFSMILLWHDRIDEAVKVAEGFIEDHEALNSFSDDIMFYLLLLIAKNQYNLVLKQFNENPNNFKDRFKPVYYALMYFMKDEFPNEYLKMGNEIKDTVEEIISRIKTMREDYA